MDDRIALIMTTTTQAIALLSDYNNKRLINTQELSAYDKHPNSY